MSNGFSKITSPQKSLRQELRKVFVQFNRRGNHRNKSSAIAEIQRQSQYASNNSTIHESTHQSGENSGDWVCFEDKIAVEHWHELTIGSAIDPEIASLNFKSLFGDAAFDYLIYSDKISRRNDGRLRDGVMRRYAHISNGGLWCSGINILTWEDSVWGGFKPNTPRIDENKGKPIKYEHPLKVDTEIFALRIPSRIWELISRRYDVALPENYQSLPHSAFWQWVKENPQIPTIICEGAKKAAAILSCGYVAIALPGVNNGYRQPRDEYDEACGAPSLIPQLAVFAQQGRRIYFCFDADSKRSTIRGVNHALARTAKLLTLRGCEVKVMCWHGALGKGIDDVIAACGREQFDKIYCDALTLDEWHTKQLKRLTYTPDLILNQRYLGEISIPPNKQLIVFKSASNTGKSTLLQSLTDPVIRSGERRVLCITHRVQLGLDLSPKLGIPFVSKLEETPQGKLFGMILCIDSLHLKSKARFNPEDWKGCWLILDEVQQLIWHLLSSTTCQKERVVIIKNFKQLLLNIVNYGGKIFIADADLNDISVDFIKGLIGQEIDTFIVENTFKYNEPWQINVFNGKNPAQLVNVLSQKLDSDKKCFVCLSGQKPKSRWGSYNLEAYYKKRNPDLRILRIDSSTVEDPGHPAFECTDKLNEIIKDYDLVLATPTIETGVDIKVEHFDYVFGIFQGVQTTDSARQHLSRYRPSVPRSIWISGVGINKVGNGSNTVKGLLAGEYRKNKANIKKLTELGFEETIEGNFENICINTWAKMGAIINDGMRKYSKQILEDLQNVGHLICDPEELPEPAAAEITKKEIDANQNEEYSNHCDRVEAEEDITDERFDELKNKRRKTPREQLQLRKGELKRRYNIDNVTSDVVRKDDNGWYSPIRINYYFGEGRQFLADKDKNTMDKALKNGDGDYFIVDTNKNFLAKKIDALDYLEFDKLIQVEEISNNHQTAIDLLGKVKKYSYDLKLLLGIDFSKVKTPMEACRRLSAVIGYKFPMLRKEGKRGSQVRIYGTPAPDFQKDDEGKLILVDGRAVPISDRREEVFKAWVERDTLAQEKAAAAKLETETQAAKLVVPESPVISHQPTAQEQAIADFDSKTDINSELILVEQATVPALTASELTAQQSTTSGSKCWVWHYSQWLEAIVQYWEHRPQEKFFKAIVNFVDGSSRIIWQRECIQLFDEAIGSKTG